jgi:peptidoglycan/LPS O-acetylase OafA/YrhL
MNTYVDTWGSDFALWSLKFEWWFYMLFPLFFLVLRKSSFFAFSIIILLYILSFYPEYWPNKLLAEIFSSMIVWWLGVIMADIYTRRIKIEVRFLMPLSLLIPVIIFLKLNFGRQVQDLLWGLGFIGLLSIFFYLLESGKSLKALEKWSWLGSFSYSLYISHMPILVFISGYLLKQNSKLPLTFEYVILGIIICVIFAWAIHYLIERPFLSKKGPSLKKTLQYNNAL